MLTETRRLVYSFVLAILIVGMAVGGGPPAFAGQVATQDTPPIPSGLKTIWLSKSSEIQGKEFDLTVLWLLPCSGPDSDTTGLTFLGASSSPPTPAPSNSLPPGANLISDGRGIAITVTERHKCSLVAHVVVAGDAPPGTALLRLLDSSGKPAGMAAFDVKSAQEGPLPPGLDHPAVDVMWKVLPKGSVEDNFGHRVATLFYCVEVLIGNNSGFELQIAGIGFRLRSSNGPPIPSDGFQSVKGSMLWGQLLTPRKFFTGSFTALDTVITGGIPFIRNKQHLAVWASFGAFAGGPLDNALSVLWPDQTVGELDRLSEQSLRDSLIVPNNTQVRTLTFISKQSLEANFKRLSKEEKDDPVLAKQKLGGLVMVGDEIQHVNRIHLTTAGTPSATSVKPDTVTADGKPVPLTIAGVHLDNATVSGPPGFAISDTKASADGTSVALSLAVAASVPPDSYRLTVATSGGSTPVTLKVVAAPAPLVTFSPTSLTFTAVVVKSTSQSQKVTLQNTGNADLTGISVTIAGDNKADFSQTPSCGATLTAGKSCDISVTFTPTAAGARKGTLTVTDNAAGSPQSVGLTGTGGAAGP
ncbi:MAG TPA: choice-of-anchor D domain-containing protein [Terriglobia bacterium]|nr:choice-of-anchor D domain-containing protein [Terriglobia bacterium]